MAGAEIPHPTISYKVQTNDTLAYIAKISGGTTDELEKLNAQITNPDIILKGDVLRVPMYNLNQNDIYKIQPRDTLYSIKRKLNLTDSQIYTIKQINGIVGDKIYEGNTLVLSDITTRENQVLEHTSTISDLAQLRQNFETNKRLDTAADNIVEELLRSPKVSDRQRNIHLFLVQHFANGRNRDDLSLELKGRVILQLARERKLSVDLISVPIQPIDIRKPLPQTTITADDQKKHVQGLFEELRGCSMFKDIVKALACPISPNYKTPGSVSTNAQLIIENYPTLHNILGESAIDIVYEVIKYYGGELVFQNIRTIARYPEERAKIYEMIRKYNETRDDIETYVIALRQQNADSPVERQDLIMRFMADEAVHELPLIQNQWIYEALTNPPLLVPVGCSIRFDQFGNPLDERNKYVFYNLKLAIARNLYFQRRNKTPEFILSHPISEEIVKKEVQRLAEEWNRFGEIRTFDGRSVLLFANPEENGERFAPEGLVPTIQSQVGSGSIMRDGFMLPENIQRPIDFKLDVLHAFEENIQNPLSITLFRGHGEQDYLALINGAEKDGTISERELFRAYRNNIRIKPWPTLEERPIIVLGACFTANFARKFIELCAKNHIPIPTIIGGAEYGQFGYTDNSVPFNSKLLAILSLPPAKLRNILSAVPDGKFNPFILMGSDMRDEKGYEIPQQLN